VEGFYESTKNLCDNEFLCVQQKAIHWLLRHKFSDIPFMALESMDAIKNVSHIKNIYIGSIGCALLPALLNAAILWQLLFRNEFDSAQFAF
jgi:hypothetical protein